MIITNKVNVNLKRQASPAIINVVQDDRYSRNLEMSLYEWDVPWEIPNQAEVLIRYSKPDCTAGEYDTLPDGTIAWSAEENVLTVALAPQVLTVPGPVTLSVRILREAQQLSTFFVLLHVHSAVGREIAASDHYFHVTAYLPSPASAKSGLYFRIAAVDKQGKVTKVEAVDLKGSDADPETVQRIVAEYLEENPPEDGADGKDGADGADGISAAHYWNGTVLTMVSASGTSSSDLKGAKGDKGDKGDDGQRGMTGAVGPQGPVGPAGPIGIQGPQGEPGKDGADGRTPVRGTDYWTDGDKAEIRAYVDEAILGGAW